MPSKPAIRAVIREAAKSVLSIILNKLPTQSLRNTVVAENCWADALFF